MSNGYRLELLQGKDVVYLNYWDSLAGNDKLFEIKNGKAYTEIEGVETEVDLPKELEELVKRLDSE